MSRFRRTDGPSPFPRHASAGGGGARPPASADDGRRGAVVAIDPRTVMFVLAGSIVACVAAGSAVSAIEITTGADYMLGFRDLLDLNGEGNLPAWLSSSLLLGAAGLLVMAGAGRPRAERRRWLLLAGTFVLLSIDEAASLHELLNAPLRAAIDAGPMLYFPWIVVGLAFAAAVGLAERRLLTALPRATRRAFLAAGAVYMAGAVGFEALAAPLYASSPRSGAHAALIIAEESLELIGTALFVGALIAHIAREGGVVAFAFHGRSQPAGAPPGVLHLDPAGVTRALLTIVCGLALLSVGLQTLHYSGGLRIPAAVRLVNLSREANLPTWYQASAFLGCAALAAAIAAGERQRGTRFAVHWVVVGASLVYLSADEAGGVHELSVRPLRETFHTSGLLYYPWVLIGAAAVATAAIAARGLLASLPAGTRRSLVLATAVFVTGALGVEALGGMVAESRGRDNGLYAALTTVEETLEMLGLVMVIRAFLTYLANETGGLRLVVSPPGPSRSG